MTDEVAGRDVHETLGQRIRYYRTERGLTSTELADRAELSKSYISSLESESEPERKPSAEVLYRIARALGVAMSDLLGKTPLVASGHDRPPELVDFARQYNLPETDVAMLASIEFRGDRPRTVDRWRFIYDAIKNSERMDRT
jgi:transcriptional regulator with XRE-family HTH domain